VSFSWADADGDSTAAGGLLGASAANISTGKATRLFAMPFMCKNASFDQDRLGTNIGKALKKARVAAGLCSPTALRYSLPLSPDRAALGAAVQTRVFCDAILY